MKTLYSAKEAGEMLDVSNSQILKLIARGDIDALLVGKQYVIHRDQIDKYKATRRPVGRPSKVSLASN